VAMAADLEIVLAWRSDQSCFELSIAFDDPNDTGDRRKIWPEPITIDTDGLRKLRHDAAAYGRALTDQLFTDEELRDFYRRAKSWAQQENLPLRVRLSIDPDAPARLQAVRWETLVDLDTGVPLGRRTDVWVSRYLSGADWDRVKPPRKHDLRALVVIANPTDLAAVEADRPLAPVNVEAELARAKTALGTIRHEVLGSGGTATLDRIANALERKVDVLYLVCHGFFRPDGQPLVVLEDETGQAHPVTPVEFAEQLSVRAHKPTLAVVCSCQSAGAGVGPAETADKGALAPLGPQLARAGVAAVVAMQHDVSMETAGDFLSRFFEELDRDGIVDRAVAAARITIADRRDWWVPVLFTRLKRGHTYYSVGFSGDELKIKSFVSQVKHGKCTPVLGPGLAEALIGTRPELARKWVERWLLPISTPDNENLTTVGQFVQAGVTTYAAQLELSSYLISELERDERYEDIDRRLFEGDDPTALFEEIGRRARKNKPKEPHAMMASLDLPVYITTSWTDFLSDALKARGHEPQVRSFTWNEDLPVQPEIEEPSPERPLVYHLYGQLQKPESLVLTEDDYFQWLAAWAELRQEKTPSPVTEALMTRPLMFVGYRLHDWDFRVLFQGLRNFRGNDRFRKRPHIGVQVDPNAPGVEPEAAQEYLNKYFAEGGITIYWGKTEEFLSELSKRMSSS
jgi:CHAT domain/SIR2-like domain